MNNISEMKADRRLYVKERFKAERNMDSFAEVEALEMLLFYASARNDAYELASKMLKEFGGLGNLFDAFPVDIEKRCGVTENTAILLSMVPKLAKKYSLSKWERSLRLFTSESAGKYLIDIFTDQRVEMFYILCLDAQRRLINCCRISEGTIEESPIYVRNIVQAALQHNSVSVVLAHNHPGCSITASGADVEATRQVVRAFELLDIIVLDHIIVAGAKYFSFAENGGLLGLRY